MKQYEFDVELMDRVYDRRTKTNMFYVLLNSILFTALAAFLSQATKLQANCLLIAVEGLAGVVYDSVLHAYFSSSLRA